MSVCETATAHFDHIVEGHSDLDLQLIDPKIQRSPAFHGGNVIT